MRISFYYSKKLHLAYHTYSSKVIPHLSRVGVMYSFYCMANGQRAAVNQGGVSTPDPPPGTCTFHRILPCFTYNSSENLADQRKSSEDTGEEKCPSLSSDKCHGEFSPGSQVCVIEKTEFIL